VAKKQQLEKIVRGKGLEALRPTPEYFPSEKRASGESKSETREYDSISNLNRQEVPGLSDETIEEQTTEQEQLNKNTIIARITPTGEQQSYIQQQLSDDSHQILIWDLFISQDGNNGSVFQPGIPVSFNICCTASGLIAQLKPEIDIHWISYDLLRMQMQPLYKFFVNTKPLWNHFKIQFQIKPDVTGFFNFHVIVDLKAAGLFWVREGFVFKIVDDI
jgi:hypothetical protein